MTRRTFQLDCLNPKFLLIGGNVTITASGAISAQSGSKKSGGTVTQTGSEDGRYAIAFDRTYKEIHSWGVTMQGPDDSAMPTTTGSDPVTRLVSNAGFSAQFKRTDTQADADPASGTVFAWWALVSK